MWTVKHFVLSGNEETCAVRHLMLDPITAARPAVDLDAPTDDVFWTPPLGKYYWICPGVENMLGESRHKSAYRQFKRIGWKLALIHLPDASEK